MEQKQQRINDSKSCLALFTRNKKDFLRRYVTVDETWIHHFTPESSRQSAEWRMTGESRPKRAKTQQSATKVMTSVFWDANGIIFIDYLEKGKTINSDYYMVLLDRLKAEIAKKRPHMKKKNLSSRQRTVPQVNQNDDQIQRIRLPTASSSSVLAGSGPQRLLARCGSQKDAPGKKIWLK